MSQESEGPPTSERQSLKLEELQARALEPLIDLILDSFVHDLPKDAAATILPWLETAEGRAAFRAKWPLIIEGYLEALRARDG